MIHTLELKLWPFEVSPICLYREAMQLQCFSPTRYVSVRYLENASMCSQSIWPWLFCVISRHGKSEEEAPASAYLRAVPKGVAGFVYTERGKST